MDRDISSSPAGLPGTILNTGPGETSIFMFDFPSMRKRFNNAEAPFVFLLLLLLLFFIIFLPFEIAFLSQNGGRMGALLSHV